MAKKKGQKKGSTTKASVGRRAIRSWDIQRAVVMSLLTIAFLVAAYLGWNGLRSGLVAGCGPESGCGDVLTSRWSSWFGIPVSLFALPLYLLLVFSILRLPETKVEPRFRALGFATATASLLIILAALWFIGLQALIIRRFCPWCLLAHSAGMLASGWVLWRLLFSLEKVGWKGLLTSRLRGRACVFGVLAWLLLVGGQLVYVPDKFAVVELPETIESTVAPKERQVSEKSSDQTLSLYGGQLVLKAMDHPVMGNPESGRYLLSLFDYTCHSCRTTHKHLKTLVERFPEELAVISLPVPLNADCNHVMQRQQSITQPAHRDACQYAALSLAVFKSKREGWEEFDDWLFTGDKPPSVTEANARALEVVGNRDAIKQVMGGGWLRDQVRLGVELYGASRQGRLPQLIVGHSILVGEVNDSKKLFSVVASEFGLSR